MIYFDNAATTFPKPPAVGAAMLACMRCAGGNPGRGTHAAALRAAEVVYSCRCRAAEFFGVSDPARVVFTLNTTYALNMALKSILRPGDHVISGDMEHNATVRPLAALAKKGITVSRFSVRQEPMRMLEEIRALIRSNTRVLVCAHSSNIAGITVPAAQIGALCRECGILFLLDGAQSAGILPVHVENMHIDILCVPGHKGLYGPQGCGVMLLGENCPVGCTLIEGGSGVHSADTGMPAELPEHFEAGTLPVPAIAGLEAGIRFLTQAGMDAVRNHECFLWNKMAQDLSCMQRVHIADYKSGAILLFTVDGLPPSAVADALDTRGICVRAGYHCAPLAHRTLGTEENGAVRVSFGAMNTEKEVCVFTDALRQILRENP